MIEFVASPSGREQDQQEFLASGAHLETPEECRAWIATVFKDDDFRVPQMYVGPPRMMASIFERFAEVSSAHDMLKPMAAEFGGELMDYERRRRKAGEARPDYVQKILAHATELTGGKPMREALLRAHAGLYDTAPLPQQFAQGVVKESGFVRLETLASTIVSPLHGDYYKRTRVIAERDDIDNPDVILNIKCAMKLLVELQSTGAEDKKLSPKKALQFASTATMRTLKLLASEGSRNAQYIINQLAPPRDKTSDRFYKQMAAVSADHIVGGAARISEKVRVQNEAFSELEPGAQSLPVAVDRLFFIATQLGPFAEDYAKNKTLQRATSTMQEAIHTVAQIGADVPWTHRVELVDVLARYSSFVPAQYMETIVDYVKQSGQYPTNAEVELLLNGEIF